MTRKEIKIINTPWFQRLRRIKQLGNTHLVYPSACHTRFEHSIGVLHLANRMAHNLNLDNDDEELQVIRCAALLHDVGHGPMSHIFEKVLQIANGKKVKHEDITLKIIKEDGDLDTALGDSKNCVISLLDKSQANSVSGEIISSNLDADRLDYLLRDSHHIGVAYGIFDLERILHTIDKQVNGDESYLVVKEKGKDAVEGIRLARYFMHAQVYSHHIRTVSDNMFARALELALRDDVLDKGCLKVSDKEFLNNYLMLDDNRIFDIILRYKSKDGNVPPAVKIMKDLESRKLMKMGYEVNRKSFSYPYKFKIDELEGDMEKRIKFEGRLAEACGCEKDHIMTGTKTIDTTTAKQGKTPILIKMKDSGDVREMDDISPIKFGEDIQTFYIVCPATTKDCFNHLTVDQISKFLS